MLSGIDFSYGSGLTVDQIKAAGKDFVCRYLSGGGSKDIDKLELSNYLAAGIQVVFVWETTGLMPSEAQGVADAQVAQRELDTLGAAQAVVFFAADASSEADLPGYLKGAASVLGKARVGVYGGLASVRTAFDQGLVTYGWQTYAWSNGEWDARALLQQYANGARVGPASVDLDRAEFPGSSVILTKDDDYGQWPRPVSPRPTPAPVTTVAVPDVMGKASATAQSLIELAGLTAAIPSLAAGDIGKVTGQSPIAGSQVAKGSTVTVTLDAIKMVTVPNVVGLDLAAATSALIAAGLSESSPAVTVASQSPAAGGSVTADGTTIMLTLTVEYTPVPTPAPTPAPVPTPAPTPAPPPPPGPTKEPELRSGMSGDSVRLLQTLLNEKELAGLKVDGVFGSNTETAVRRFQQRRNLAQDGVAGPNTWAALGNYS